MDKIGFGALLVYIALILAGIVGYVMNVFAIVYMFLANGPVTTLLIGRLIGLFVFPLGGVLGYF